MNKRPLHELLSPIQRRMLDPFGPGRLYDTTTKCPICQVKAAKVLYNAERFALNVMMNKYTRKRTDNGVVRRPLRSLGVPADKRHRLCLCLFREGEMLL